MEKHLIWDVPTRVFHWLLAICFCGSWATAEAGYDWTQIHFYFGYTTLGLVLFRVLWGVVGTPYARFANFVRSPLFALKQFPQLTGADLSGHHGHSATGGWAVIALLTLMFIQAFTGLFVSDDIFYAGPYNSVVSGDVAGNFAQAHHLNFTALQVLIGMHLATIAWYQWRKGENLTGAMLTGRKLVAPPKPLGVVTPWGVAVVCAVLSAIAIVALVQFAPEPEYLY